MRSGRPHGSFLASNRHMLFRSYRPIPPLSVFIENFWLYDGYSCPHLKERILPSGTFEIVFNLRDDELRIYKSDRSDRCARFHGAVVSGPYAGYFASDTAEEASVMGVHFRPGGAFPFLGFSAGELADTHIGLEDIWGPGAGYIRERLSSEKTHQRRFEVLENVLLSRLLRPLGKHPAVMSALDLFSHDISRAVVRKAVRGVGISNRRLADLFDVEVGVKPKLYTRIQRFQRVLHTVHRASNVEWGQLALQHGYYDQAHLIRDFVAFSGFTPGEYFRHLRQLRGQGLHVKFNHLPISG